METHPQMVGNLRYLIIYINPNSSEVLHLYFQSLLLPAQSTAYLDVQSVDFYVSVIHYKSGIFESDVDFKLPHVLVSNIKSSLYI